MSLKDFRDAILEIADDMLEDARELLATQGTLTNQFGKDLRSYARQLKTACKAVGEDTPVQGNPFANNPEANSLLIPPEVYHRIQIEKAKKEFSKKNIETEERFDGDMVDVVGGPVCPDDVSITHTIDPQMPLGAYMNLAGGVYKLCKVDGVKRLVYDETATQSLEARQQH